MAKNSCKPVYVTQSSLPPLDKYARCVEDIFQSHWLTNQGKYAEMLERELANRADSPTLALCSNGTLALQLALRLLELDGRKIITTPFTYVATLSSLLWERCEPVLADIDPHTLCIDPAEIKRLLTMHPDVAGIMPVHVFGNACDVEAISDLAMEYGIKVIYDAAHAFGARLGGKSLLAYGDAATCSFHSTKLFHTVEGGCVATPNPEDKKKLRLLRAFGHVGDSHQCLGINAKMSELHAAMGICLLPGLDDAIQKRAERVAAYNEELDLNAKSVMRAPSLHEHLEWNYAYYPVIFETASKMKAVLASLEKNSIHPRRYFYPSLSTLPYVATPPCPVSEDMAERILCLPLWPDMEKALIKKIASIIHGALREV